MKVKNPSTGNFEEVYVKALDSLPVGSEIDFTGSASDIPVGWEQVDTGKTYKAYELYSNSSGSSSSIELNDSVANYKFIEIYYMTLRGNNRWGSCKILDPNNKAIVLNETVTSNASKIWNCITQYNISETAITKQQDKYVTFATGDTVPVINTDAPSFNIYTVIGYKEV